MIHRLAIVLLAATAAARAQSPSFPDVPVTMPAADQSRMGVSSTALEAREVPVAVPAIVRAVDPAPLAQLDADLAAAAAASAAADRELRRTQDLAAQDQSASQQALETARARALTERANVKLLRRRLGIEWGPYFQNLSDDSRGILIGEVTSGSAALLRADAPSRADGISGQVLVDIDAERPPLAARPLGLSGSADPRMQTVGLFCLVRGSRAAALRAGRTFAGRIETDETATGVVIPRSALVRLGGAIWAYVRTGEETFVRRELDGARPLDDGWLVTRGFDAGVEVVDRGAGSLAALERSDGSIDAD